MATEIVERDVERVFHLHCSCGSTLVSNQRIVACTTCGKTLEVRRVRKRGLSPVAVEYHFDCCFCGVAVVSPTKVTTCAHCGKTLRILRAEKLMPRRRPSPLKYALTQDVERLWASVIIMALILCYFLALIFSTSAPPETNSPDDSVSFRIPSERDGWKNPCVVLESYGPVHNPNV